MTDAVVDMWTEGSETIWTSPDQCWIIEREINGFELADGTTGTEQGDFKLFEKNPGYDPSVRFPDDDEDVRHREWLDVDPHDAPDMVWEAWARVTGG